jgi:magnesium transporter
MWGVSKSDERTSELSTWEDLETAWATQGAIVWVDLENPTSQDLLQLDRIIDLDDVALDECLTGEPRPRIDDCGDYLLLVAYGVIVAEGERELESRKLAMFRGDRFLVTIHTQPSRSVAALKARCERNPDAVLSQGVDQMLYRFCAYLFTALSALAHRPS